MSKILLLTSWGSALPHVIGGYARALIKAGHEIKLADMSVFGKKEYASVAGQLGTEFIRTVKEFAPDLAVFYGTQGIINIDGYAPHLFESLGIPFMSLFYDNPLLYFQELDKSLFASLLSSENYSVSVSDRIYIDRLRAIGFRRICFLPLATEEELFNENSGSNAFDCEVSFVGSIEDNPLSVRQKRQQRLARFPTVNKFLDDMLDIAETPLTSDIMPKMQPLTSQMPWDVEALIFRVVYEESSTLYRVAYVSAVKDRIVNVYGSSAWERVVKDNIVYKGYLDYADNAGKLYRGSNINLNITHPQLVTAINQRVYDVSLCGGFVLSDYRNDLVEFFDDAAVYYKNIDDMNNKIDYFLKNGAERKDMSARMQEIVRKNHLWKHRAETLIEFVKGAA